MGSRYPTFMTQSYVFGYGSLVNTATHVFDPVYPAKLDGWRRVWRCIPGQTIATLSVERAEGAKIDGLIAGVQPEHWPDLDARELHYERHVATPATQHSGPDAAHVQVYVVPPELDEGRHPILLSYLDVVVQGYYQRFGEDGVAAFFETTRGWDTGLRDDRANPKYPRHKVLSPFERGLVDDFVRDTY